MPVPVRRLSRASSAANPLAGGRVVSGLAGAACAAAAADVAAGRPGLIRPAWPMQHGRLPHTSAGWHTWAAAAACAAWRLRPASSTRGMASADIHSARSAGCCGEASRSRLARKRSRGLSSGRGCLRTGGGPGLCLPGAVSEVYCVHCRQGFTGWPESAAGGPPLAGLPAHVGCLRTVPGASLPWGAAGWPDSATPALPTEQHAVWRLKAWAVLI